MAESGDQIVQELALIRKLLIIAILNSGMSQEKLAKALDVNQSSISRVFSSKKARA
jgi:predicted XRE-type DNA-binding protein